MDNALGMIEFKTIAKGIEASDHMVKTSKVEIVKADTFCPGRFMILIKGTIGAVKAAMEKGNEKYQPHIVDTFVLGNPHDSIYDALSGTYLYENVGAMGVIETRAVPSILKAADAAAKSATIGLKRVTLGNGIGGKGIVIFTGDIAAVEEALSIGAMQAETNGMLVDFSIIPNPDKQIWQAILG